MWGSKWRLNFANRLRDGKSDGTKEFSFSINPGATFIALSTSNLLLPPSNWTMVGAPTNAAQGLFQFNFATDEERSTTLPSCPLSLAL
jgi:hypothetical protein